MPQLRLLNWNIMAGGGSRVGQIVERIVFYAPDICVLSEYRAGRTGKRISDSLAVLGYSCLLPTAIQPGSNSAAIFSRGIPMEGVVIQVPSEVERHVICADFAAFILIGVFGATPGIGSEIVRFLRTLPDLVPGRSLLATGDFYFGPRPSDNSYRRHLAPLAAAGWVDLWSSELGKTIYWSFDNGRGKSRPDHLFAHGSIARANWRVEYSSSELADRLSDHAPMLAVQEIS